MSLIVAASLLAAVWLFSGNSFILPLAASRLAATILACISI